MKMKVLIVDDHDANRAVLRRRLERRGFEVDEARSGIEAIEKCSKEAPDCILMDLSMPQMSGFEAYAHISRTLGKGRVPTIALTAHALESMREKSLGAGFDAFLTKPIDFEELVQCITRLSTAAA